MDAVLCCLVVVTAADRAAATCQLSFLTQVYRQVSGRRGGGGDRKATALCPQARNPRLRRGEIPLGSFRRRASCAFTRMTENTPPRRMSAAALSAAVDSRQPTADRTHLAGGIQALKESHTPDSPAALRRGVAGERRFSQRSGLSPSVSPTTRFSLRKGARGGASL